jgi:hypothetical protein
MADNSLLRLDGVAVEWEGTLMRGSKWSGDRRRQKIGSWRFVEDENEKEGRGRLRRAGYACINLDGQPMRTSIPSGPAIPTS